MNLTVLLITLLFGFIPFLQKKDPYAHSTLVNYYHVAAKNEKEAENFLSLMEKYKGKDPVVTGYKAVANAIMAKHAWSPYSKLKYLKNSSRIFEDAVKLSPSNAEVRFLRYSIENYVPRYLNMSSNLVEDKKVFMAALLRHPKSGIPKESAKIMVDFLLRKELVSGEEKRQVQNLQL